MVSLATIAITWDARLPSGIVTTALVPVLRVQQRRPGQGGLHVAVEYEEAGLEAGRVGAVLGREDERAGALDHAVLQHRRGQLGGALARRHLDGHGRRDAGPGVVSRVHLGLVDVPDVEDADRQRYHDHQQRDPRREPGGRDRDAAARAVSAVAAIAAAAAVAVPVVAVAAGGPARAAGVAVVVAGAAAAAHVLPRGVGPPGRRRPGARRGVRRRARRGFGGRGPPGVARVVVLGVAAVEVVAGAEAGQERVVALAALPALVAGLAVAGVAALRVAAGRAVAVAAAAAERAAGAGAARVIARWHLLHPAGAARRGLAAGAARERLAAGPALERLRAGARVLLRAGPRPLRGVAGPGARVGLAVAPGVVPGLAAVALTGIALALALVVVLAAVAAAVVRLLLVVRRPLAVGLLLAAVAGLGALRPVPPARLVLLPDRVVPLRVVAGRRPTRRRRRGRSCRSYGVPGFARQHQVAGGGAGAALGLQRRLEQHGGGGRVDRLPPRPRVVPGRGERAVRGRRGEALVDQSHRERCHSIGEIRRELPRGNGGRALTARQRAGKTDEDLDCLFGRGQRGEGVSRPCPAVRRSAVSRARRQDHYGHANADTTRIDGETHA